LLADSSFQKLAQLPVAGGTELAPALRHVLEIAAAHSPGRPKSLILITDAQVDNEPVVLKIMESAPDFPVHCFGIDIALNDALLLALARKQNGTFHSLNPVDDVAGAVTKLAQTIRHPVLTDLKLSGSWDLAEASIPSLYAGQIHYLSARSQSREGLELTAQNGSEQRSGLTISPGIATGEAPYLHWCKNRIQRCLTQQNPAEAIALSIKSNLICPLTAFITWDEFEKVAVARHSLAQPVFGLRAGQIAADQTHYLMAPTRMTSMGATQALNEFGLELCLASMVGPQPDPDDDMVMTIADAQGARYAVHPDQQFAMEERRAAFHRLFLKICQRCFHSDWLPLCERILAWTFENKHEATSRSKRLAKLMCYLLPRSKVFEFLRQSKRDTANIELEIQSQLENYAMGLEPDV